MPASASRAGPLIAVVAVVILQLAILHPGVLFRGEVLTSSALAYGMQPWHAHLPPRDRPLRGNPVLSDDMFFFTPWDREVREATTRRRLPLWSARSGCGMPLLANNQSAVLAPTHGIRLLWDSPRARTYGLCLKVLLAAVGMHLLLARWGAGPAGAVTGALAWSGCASMTAWLFYPLTETAAWLSWVVLGITKLIDAPEPGSRRARRGAGIVLAASLAAMLLSGHLPTAVQLLIAVGVGVAAWAWAERNVVRRLPRLVVPALTGALVAMPQMLPAAGYILHSHAREARGGATPSATSHLPIEAAWSWLVPRGFGSPERFGYSGPSNFNEATACVGLVALLLALTAVVLVRGRLVARLALGVAAAAALAYGLPPLPWIAGKVPLLEWTASQRWIIPAQWGVAALAGIAVGALARVPRRRALLTLALLVTGLLVAIVLHPALRQPAGADALAQARSAGSARAVLLASIELVVAAALVALVIVRRHRAVVVALVVGVSASGVLLAWRFNPSLPADVIPAETPETRRLAEIAGDGRILPIGWALRPNTPVLAGLRSVVGEDFVLPERYPSILGALDYRDLERMSPLVLPAPGVAARLAARVVVADRPLSGEGLDRVEDLQGPGLWAAVVREAHPLVALYPRSLPDSGAPPDDVLRAASRLGDGTVLLSGDAVAEGSESSQGHRAVPFKRGAPERLSAQVDAAEGGWLVFRETADPGWRATVDGAPRSWRVADGVFMAVQVPSGKHEVEFRYRPRGFWIALSCAAVGLAWLVWSAAALRVRGPRTG